MSRARAKRAVPLRFVVCLLAVTIGLWGTASRADQKTVAQENDWNPRYEPFRVIGNIYYVGTIELGVYLITTPAGHLLVDGGLPQSTPVIEAAIGEAGSKGRDIE